MIKELKPHEKTFAEAFIANNGNAKEAYHVIFPDASPDTCRKNGYKYKNKPHIQAYIAELYEEHFGEYKILAFQALAELEEMAFAEKGDKDYNASTKLKAIELIQKQLGLQTKNINAHVDGKNEIEINIVPTRPDNDDKA